MPLPTTLATYTDCYEIWAAALDTPGGCRSRVGPEISKAEHLRSRMYMARKLQRDYSRKVYPQDHKSHNTSEYDHLKITIRQDEKDLYWLYIEPQGNWSAVNNIEPIPEEERDADAPSMQTPLQIDRHEITALPDELE